LISIVIATYNRAFILQHTLNSIIGQNYDEWELIIIDDGSTDETEKIIRSYEMEKMRYIKTEHRGSPHAWNTGAMMAEGDSIFFVGDDVILAPNCLEKLIKTRKKLPRRIGGIAPRLIYVRDVERKHSPMRSHGEYLHIDRLTGDVRGFPDVPLEGPVEVEMIHGYSLVDREAFLDVGGFDTVTYTGNFYREETDLWMRMRKRGYRLYYEPEAEIYVRKGLTTGGQWANVGGSLLKYEYYVLRNHYAYLRKFYGLERYFMFPLFILRRLNDRVREYLLARRER